MLDIKFIRENPEVVKKATAAKQLDPGIVDDVLELDKKWKGALVAVEELRKERNVVSKERTQEAISRGQSIKKDLKKLEEDLFRITEDYEAALKEIPNLVSEDTPEGPDESGNKVVRSWGEPKKFKFQPKDYMDLGESLGLLDTKKASEVTGSRFSYLLGDAVLLEYALLQFAFSVLLDESRLKEIAQRIQKGYSHKPFIPVIPPLMIKPDVFDKMGRLNPSEERYHIATDDLYLIGSAEHTLGPLHMDETLDFKDLPKRYIGFTPAFRREAGSYGLDTKGVLRVHQFDKIEMESFTSPEAGLKEQEFFVAIQEYLMQQLNLPYQVVAICAGDMGKPDFRQIDLETWFPAQDRYRETHTSDYMTDFQARRLNTKVQEGNESDFVHMNDATVFSQRPILAILENYQQEDGSVVVPKVLRKWMGKNKIGF